MPPVRSWTCACVLGLLAIAAYPPLGSAQKASGTASLHVPVEQYKLPNGLKVVLSRESTVPTAVVAVYYGVGFRVEPRDRTGFAHLFEHLMFQGSQHMGKLAFATLVQSNGGVFNGSTRFDFTNYFEAVPASTLPVFLWAE